MPITLKKINDEVVKPVKTALTQDSRPVLGEAIFSDPTCNVLLCAHKGSGKTSVIAKILKKCASPNQSIIVVGSTVNQDPVWLAIRKWCKQHKIPFMGLTSMRENGADFFKVFLKKLQEEGEERNIDSDDSDDDVPVPDEADEDCQPETIDFFGQGKPGRQEEDDDYEYSDDDEEDFRDRIGTFGEMKSKTIKLPKRNKTSLINRSKYQEPAYTIILDDISSELKTPSLVAFLKFQRHFRCRVLNSTQFSKDFLPQSIGQMDYLLLFGGLDEAKLKKLHRDAGLSIDFDDFMKIYDDATRQKYNFLYVDTRNNAYRKNFDKQYFISQENKHDELPASHH